MRGNPPDPGFAADLEFLQSRDLDLSIRFGGLLAFNALMATIGTHPISASPGAPLSLDAHGQPIEVIASLIGLLPFIWSSVLCLRALMAGEEFEVDDEKDGLAMRRRLLAVFIRSVELQSRLLHRAIVATLVGGGLTTLVWAWILAVKMV